MSGLFYKLRPNISKKLRYLIYDLKNHVTLLTVIAMEIKFVNIGLILWKKKNNNIWHTFDIKLII